MQWPGYNEHSIEKDTENRCEKDSVNFAATVAIYSKALYLRKDDEILELTKAELDGILADEDSAASDGIPEYYFSNPDPYAKAEPCPDDAPKHDATLFYICI